MDNFELGDLALRGPLGGDDSDLLAELAEGLGSSLEQQTHDTGDVSKQCWGWLLSGQCTSCTPGFVGGKGHFKNHFCPTCRATGFKTPATRLRALLPQQHAAFPNGMGAGLWTDHDESGIRFRLVNQTVKCSGPRVIILQSAPTVSGLLFASMPDRWVDGNGMVHLSVSKGTLAPMETVDANVGRNEASSSSSGFELEALLPSLASFGGHNKRSRPGSSASSGDAREGSFTGSAGTSTAQALVEVHERLSTLVVQSFSMPETDQEAEGIDDEQRAAFVSLLAPLQLSTSLLKRQHNNGNSVLGGNGEKSPAGRTTADADDEMDDAEPTEADVEALAALNAKLFGALEKLATRNQLCCSYRGLTDSDLVLAWRALRNGSVAGSVTTIVRLDLSSNYLTSSSAETLGELLGHAVALEALDLSGTPWGTSGIELLTNGLAKSGMQKLQRLCLRRAAVGAAGAAAIGKLLAETRAPSLTELSVTENHMGDAGFQAIAGGLAIATSFLTTLALGNSHGGNLIGDAGALLIAEAIRATRLAKLVHLGLSYNSITDEGSHALAEALRADQERVGIVQSLQQLTITANRLTEEGVAELFELSKEHKFSCIARPQMRVWQ